MDAHLLFAHSAQGFDEYMNLVLDQAEEVNTKTGAKRAVGTLLRHINIIFLPSWPNSLSFFSTGKILLKGDCITLLQRANPLTEEE